MLLELSELLLLLLLLLPPAISQHTSICMFSVCVLFMGVQRVYVCVCVRACMHVKEPVLGVPVLCTQILPFLDLIGKLFTPSRFATVFCYNSAICRQLSTANRHPRSGYVSLVFMKTSPFTSASEPWLEKREQL